MPPEPYNASQEYVYTEAVCKPLEQSTTYFDKNKAAKKLT